MIWLVLRVIGFVIAVALVAGVAAWLVDRDGRLTFTWDGVEYPPLNHVEAIIALALLVIGLFLLWKVVQFLIALIRFLLGDETALTRLWARSRERRGVEAVSRGQIALAEGDLKAADASARRATRLLGRRPLTLLLEAQVAEAQGDLARAKRNYRALAKEPPTAIVGVKGLLSQAVKRGEGERAMKLAEHAFAIRPRDPAIQQTLFDLQVRARNWLGAHGTVSAMLKSRALPRDVAARRQGILDLEIARDAHGKGEADRAMQAADAAVRAAPRFGPAAAFAARMHLERGSRSKGQRLLREAWKAEPQPELAQVFAEMAPDETPAERRRRFQELIKANPGHPESRLLAAELALADNDPVGARKALGDLAETRPTHRALATMAAIEKAEGSDETVVRGYLARAVTAPRGLHWVCDRCAASPGKWSAVCPSCGGFDTLAWREQAETPEDVQAAMLPLMVEEEPKRSSSRRERDREDRLDEEAAEEAVREAEEARS